MRKGRVTINNARVKKVDLKASNGVIHVINKVLLPPDVKL
ncbi:MAG: fasciclin domain-containing protein [Dolichospermum sp.]